MEEIEVFIPAKLDLEGVITFINSLNKLPASEHYIFNFSQLSRIEPFALLCVASEIRRYKAHRPRAKIEAIHYDNGSPANSYAAYMGFFKSFGVDFGKNPGEAVGSISHIPIKIRNVDTLIREALLKNMPVGELIQADARRMATMLLRQNSGDLVDTLEYSLREMLRNVVEHSESRQLAYCAQYWPYEHKVEISILDRGVGIRDTLEKNPNLEIDSDKHALYLSLLPGISGNTYKGKKRNYDMWENSGYGLFMTSELCRNGGSFFICSNTSGLLLHNNQKIDISTNINGTALRLIFNTQRIKAVSKSLELLRKRGQQISRTLAGAYINASTASSMLIRS